MGPLPRLSISALPTSRKATPPAFRWTTCRWSARTARRPSRSRSTRFRRPRGCSRPSVTVRMRETGGRAVERSLDLGVRTQDAHDRHQARTSPATRCRKAAPPTSSLIARRSRPASKKDAARACNGRWSAVERNYQWYRASGSWNYEPITSTEAMANGKIDLTADGEGKISVAGRLGPLPARDRNHRRPDGPVDQLRVRRRLVCRRRPPPKRPTGWRSRSTRTPTRRAKSPS